MAAYRMRLLFSAVLAAVFAVGAHAQDAKKQAEDLMH